MTDLSPTGSYDVLAKDLVVVFCGLNPSIEAATTGHNFGSASNRFWRALHLAGFTPHRIAAEDDRTLLRFRCGVTAAVGRPTRGAGEVGRAEFRRSADAFERKVALSAAHHRVPRQGRIWRHDGSARSGLGRPGRHVWLRPSVGAA
jgi:mismatch-specific thymine-DNA glycosylase